MIIQLEAGELTVEVDGSHHCCGLSEMSIIGVWPRSNRTHDVLYRQFGEFLTGGFRWYGGEIVYTELGKELMPTTGMRENFEDNMDYDEWQVGAFFLTGTSIHNRVRNCADANKWKPVNIMRNPKTNNIIRMYVVNTFERQVEDNTFERQVEEK